jgi:hypothetical protein
VPPHAGPAAAAAAVVLSALSIEPEKGDEKLRKFLALGSDVASGANRWKGTEKPTTPALPVPVGAAAKPTPPPPPGRSWY